jgi:NADH-quinone oxidoreductase subunit J
MATFLFYFAAIFMLASAMGVVLAKSPLRSALWLIVTLASLALLYVLLDAPFVGAMQVLVYAGAIMVLFVFVIMLLNLQPGPHGRPAYLSIAKVLGSAAALYVLYAVLRGTGAATGTAGAAVDGSVRSIGRLLLTEYLFGFEAISILLLVAVVGAVVLGMRKLT